MRGEPTHSGKILIYQTEFGDTRVDVYFVEDTIWMTQRAMSELYQTSPQNISMHIKSIYSERELTEGATCKSCLQVQTEGSRSVRRGERIQ